MAGAKVYEDKARKGFRFFDLDKNGIVTRQEMIDSADRISALGSASKFQRDCTRTQFTKWVDTLFPNGSVDEETFWKRCYDLWSTEKEMVESECRETFKHIFQGMDANKDGHVSETELADYYSAFGYDNKEYVQKVFTALDANGDGLISDVEFVEAFTKYWSDEPVYDFLFDPPQKF